MRRLRSSLAATAACVVAAAACQDVAPTAPSAAGAAAQAAPSGPKFAVAVNGSYWERFTIPGVQQLFDSAGASIGWTPHTPTAWRPTDFDVAIHSRDRGTWYTPEGFRAMHGTGCQPFQNPEPANDVRPDDMGSHAVSTYDDLNYRCRNHMMTALKSSGYGVIYVTPNYMVDWSGGEASVKFALSTLRTSGRDWVDLWITPWEDNLALPLDRDLPDMQGPPRRALHVRMTAELGRSAFEAYAVDDFREYKLTPATTDGYEKVLIPVSTRRDTFELKLSSNRLSFGMKKPASPDGPAASMTWLDLPYQSLGWTRGVVQFGHHSFNPALAANPALPAGTGGTWHWDDFQLVRAVPFTIIPVAPGEERFADATRPDVSFAQPAPAGASVRFAAYGDKFKLSTDGGATWRKFDHQPEALDVKGRFHSYMVPVPAGTTTVRFRSDDAVWFVRDPAIWSQAVPAAPPPPAN